MAPAQAIIERVITAIVTLPPKKPNAKTTKSLSKAVLGSTKPHRKYIAKNGIKAITEQNSVTIVAMISFILSPIKGGTRAGRDSKQ
jgi:ribosomal protein S12